MKKIMMNVRSFELLLGRNQSLVLGAVVMICLSFAVPALLLSSSAWLSVLLWVLVFWVAALILIRKLWKKFVQIRASVWASELASSIGQYSGAFVDIEYRLQAGYSLENDCNLIFDDLNELLTQRYLNAHMSLEELQEELCSRSPEVLRMHPWLSRIVLECDRDETIKIVLK